MSLGGDIRQVKADGHTAELTGVLKVIVRHTWFVAGSDMTELFDKLKKHIGHSPQPP